MILLIFFFLVKLTIVSITIIIYLWIKIKLYMLFFLNWPGMKKHYLHNSLHNGKVDFVEPTVKNNDFVSCGWNSKTLL